MISGKNITINKDLLIKTEGLVDAERIDRVSARLRDYVVDGADRHDASDSEESAIEVLVGSDQIALRSPLLDQRALVKISFYQGAANHRRLYGGGLSQHLAKAVGLDQRKGPGQGQGQGKGPSKQQGKPLHIVDATAGLAADSFVLASLGAHVHMLERSPVLSLMIEDALDVARSFTSTEVSTSENQQLMQILNRMSVANIDSVQWLSQQPNQGCEVIYLDPMFPERRKKAAVKKEMQVLQLLLNDGVQTESERLDEERSLLELSLSKAIYRVAVKRPRLAPPLPGPAPGYSLEGKSIRFDIYPIKKIS